MVFMSALMQDVAIELRAMSHQDGRTAGQERNVQPPFAAPTAGGNGALPVAAARLSRARYIAWWEGNPEGWKLTMKDA
jgi:hypothetical protein